MNRFGFPILLFLVITSPARAAEDSPKPRLREVASWRVRVVEKPRFGWIAPFLHGHAAVNEGGRCDSAWKCEGGRWGYFSARGKMVLPARFDVPGSSGAGGVVAREGGKTGLFAWDGRTLLEPRAGTIARLDNGFYWAGADGGSFEVVDPTGRVLFRVEGEVVGHQEALFWVSRRGRWGAFDAKGRQVVPYRFAEVSDVGNGLVAVRVGNNWGLFDGQGRQVAPLMNRTYDTSPSDIFQFNEGGRCDGILYGCEGGRFGAIDRSGKMVVPPVHDCVSVHDFDEEGVEVLVVDHEALTSWDLEDRCGGGTWRLLRQDGTPFTTEPLSFVEPFYGNPFTRTAKGGKCEWLGECTGAKYGLMDRQGRFLTPHVYDWLDEYDQLPMAFVRDGKWGFLGADYREVVGPLHELVRVDDTIVRFRSGGRWGVMDVAGKVLVPPTFEMILPFRDGRARFRDKGRWGLLDATGKVLAKPVYGVICEGQKGSYRFSRTPGCGLKQGKDLPQLVIQLPGGPQTVEGNLDAACFCDGARYGLLDGQGREVLPDRYEAILVTDARAGVTEPDWADPSVPAAVVPPGGVWVRVNRGGQCNRAGVCKGGGWGLADLTGRILVKPTHAFCAPQPDGWVLLATGGACEVHGALAHTCAPEARWGLSRLEPVEK